MPSKLILGKDIIDKASVRGTQYLTNPNYKKNRQTAKKAMKAIMKKYGKIKPDALYYHRGRGVWQEYSAKEDGKRIHRDKKTGEVITDPKYKKREIKHFGDGKAGMKRVKLSDGTKGNRLRAY